MNTALDLPKAFTRSAVGFDRLWDELDRTWANSTGTGFPPYNIIQMSDDEYQISLAVAGFKDDDLSVTKEGDRLIVEGTQKSEIGDEKYLHKGIAERDFRRMFTLAEHIEIEEAKLENGLLNIRLKKHIPEEKQPKKVEIKRSS